MGNKTSSQFIGDQPPPEKLSVFKKLEIVPDQYNIPEIPKKRQATDTGFLIIFGILLLKLFILLCYCLPQSNLNRIIHGFDPCGNVCGEENDKVDNINCTGKNMSQLKLLKYEEKIFASTDEAQLLFMERDCVSDCDNKKYAIILNRCLWKYDNFTEEIIIIPEYIENSNDLNAIWRDVVASFSNLCLIILMAIVFSWAMLILFRFQAAFVVWSILISCYSLLVILTIIIWFSDASLIGAILFTIFTVVVGIFLKSMSKRVNLVICIFREALKAIFAMPLIILEPFLTFLALLVTFVLFMTVMTNLITAGDLTEIYNGFYDYQPNFVINLAFFSNILMTYWMIQFIIGCQTMVISGAVSAWYFTRDKTFIGSPIRDSFRNLLKYHLGSVAFGSLIITIIAIIKAIINSLTRNKRTKFLANCCMNYLQRFFVYISTNSYILTAMHGESFYKSGKRAIQLLFANLGDMISINSIGDFVLFMAELLIVVCSILFGIIIEDTSINNYRVVLAIGALIAAGLAHCVFSVFSTAIDTIFLCYCEDCCINDGIERPYYMSVELREFFEQSKIMAVPQEV